MAVSRNGTLGKDLFDAGAEAEAFDGGYEYDTVSYLTAAEGVTIDQVNGANNTGNAAGDTYVSIERFFLSTHDDFYFGSDSNDAVNGGTGNDTISGGNGNDTLTGHSGDDTLLGEDGNDGMFGGGGNDVLTGGAGDDRLYGDSDDDVLAGGLGVDIVNGGTGNDVIIYTFGDGADVLTGDVGDDTLVYSLTSANFNQAIEDDLRGLQAHLESRLAGVGGDAAALAVLAAGETTEFVNLGISISTIENVTVEFDGVQTDLAAFIDGLAPQPMVLVDEPGDHNLVGGDADDTIVAGGGNDSYDGGAGYDTLDMSEAGRAVVDLNAGTASGLGTDTVSNIEAVIGSAGNDVLRGSTGDNTVVGGVGNDRIDGRGGDDHLDGGDGRDRLNGGSGNDVLSDGAGNDRVNGGNGNDVVIAGAGRDNFNGGRGFDTIDYSNAATALVINVGGRTVTGDGNDRIRGFEEVIGSGFDDTILGSDSGGEQLNGGAGDDVIRSLRGSDILTGGIGADTFTFETRDVVRGRREYGFDEITDFTTEDRLDFSAFFAAGVDVNAVVQLTENGSGTMVEAQIGRGGSFVDVVQLNDVQGLTVSQLFDDGMLIV
ncbi:MAG: hypothetical protein K0U34_01175 [Alphaproteobacteria bacterium]|nr:hypothetical protein [Alphaproteobacteria bacterium]